MLALVSIGTSPGLPDLIGLLALSGMVVTDANALLSLVEESCREGRDARTAVIEGGRRLRPLLTTPVATILALIPMTLGVGGRGGFLSTWLAVVVIGGLFTSTFLWLVVAPVPCVAVDRLRPRDACVRDEEPRAAPAPAQ